MFVGAIIKETLKDELILDYLEIDKVEIWKTSDVKIKYWTMIFFKSNTSDLPERLSKVISDGWFADMKQDNIKYIVFCDCVYQYMIGNSQEKAIVLNELRKRGIPDEQFNWEE
ncbi:MAG: helix-turn-helix transcriptional regulator [Herbinix sp.]|nr:helix-turn-helix transcriptional regulator [Herbinix sp.]